MRVFIKAVFGLALAFVLVAPAWSSTLDTVFAEARAAQAKGDAQKAAAILMDAWRAGGAGPAQTADERVRLADALVSRLIDVQRFAEAEEVGRAGLALLPEVRDPRIAAEAASVLPVPLMRTGKAVEAEKLFRAAEDWRRKVPGDTRVLAAVNVQRLAVALATQGKLAEASDALAPQVPMTLAADFPDPARGLVVPQTAAGLLMLQGRFADAVPVLEAMKPRALAIWTSPRQKAEFLETVGEAYRGTKRNAAARDAYLEGLAVLRAGNTGPITTEATLNANLARVLLLLGEPGEAAARSEQAIAVMEARAAASRDGKGALSPQDQTMLRSIAAIDLDARHAALTRIQGSARTGAEEQAFLRVQQVMADLQPKASWRANTDRTVSLTDLREAMRDDEAVILLLPGTDAVHVMGATRTGLAWHRLAQPSPESCARFARLRAGLAPSQPLRCTEAAPGSAPVAGFDAGEAHALWQDLFAPLGEAITAKPRWMIAMSGPAAAIPLGVLLMAPPAEGGFQSQTWLGRARAISYLPEPADLLRLRGTEQQRGSRQLVAFGSPCTGALAGAACNASVDGSLKQSGSLAALPADFLLMRSAPDGTQSVDGAALASLPALPAARRELAELGALYPRRAKVSLGAQATEAAVRATAVPPGAVIAFATHGLSAGAFGLKEPALVLTPPAAPSPLDDGLLTASEVQKLRFPDAFVILSACNTAGIRSVEMLDPYAGFARAFFDAGARALLVSQFEVPDEGAARLSTGLLGRLAKDPDMGRAEALRQTIDTILADPEATALHHPRAWGAMVLVGSPD